MICNKVCTDCPHFDPGDATALVDLDDLARLREPYRSPHDPRPAETVRVRVLAQALQTGETTPAATRRLLFEEIARRVQAACCGCERRALDQQPQPWAPAMLAKLADRVDDRNEPWPTIRRALARIIAEGGGS